MSERHPPQSESELIAFLRTIDEPAPAELHHRLEALIAEHGRARGERLRPSASARRLLRARPARLALGGVCVLAMALVLVLTLGGGSSGTPTLRNAVALTTLPATEAAPTQSTAHRSELTVAVQGVAFPYWEDALRWRATGARHDVLDGRPSATVFYASPRGGTVGYAIIGGAGGIIPPNGAVWRGGTGYHLATVGGTRVVAWMRNGRTCVLAARNVSYSTLLRLASWRV